MDCMPPFMLLKVSLTSLCILITSVLNSASCSLLVSILFNSFLEFCSVLSFGPCYFVSSFWQPLCVCFYVFGRAATSPRRGSSGTASSITQAGYSRYTHCVGCVYPAVVVEHWFLLAHPRSVFCPGSHSISYKTIWRWLLLVLGLNVPRWSQTVNQGQPLLEPGLGQLGKRYGPH